MPEPPSTPARGGPGRARRAASALAATLGLSLVFALAAVGSLPLHLGTNPGRRVARDVGNRVLGTLFEGKIVAGDLGSVGLFGLEVGSATVFDPRGSAVIQATGIHARIDVMALLRAALIDQGDLVLTVPFIRIDDADVLVEQGPAKLITLAETFTRPPAPPVPPGPRVAGRVVRVSLEHIELGHVWGHGQLIPGRALDADLTRVDGSVHVSPEGVAVDVESYGVVDRAFLPVRLDGTAGYHLRAGDELHMWTTFAGHAGEIEVLARGRLDGGRLRASADVPRVAPAQLAALVPGSPLRASVSAHVDVSGDLPRLDVASTLIVAPEDGMTGAVEVEGRLDVAGPARADLRIHLRSVDPRIVADVPAGSRVTAGARVRVELDAGARLTAELHSEPLVFAKQRVPAADVFVALDGDVLEGRASVHEPGIPLEVAFALTRGAGLRFTGTTTVDQIAAAPRLAGPLRGSARVRVDGTFYQGVLDARARADFKGLRVGGDAVTVGSGSFDGRVSGRLERLEVRGSLAGREVNAAGYSFDHLTARVDGPLEAPRVSARLTDGETGLLEVSAAIDPARGQARGVKVHLVRDAEVVDGSIARIGAARGGSGVEVEGVALGGKGIGLLQGSLAVRGKELVGSLHGDGVDLGSVARLAGLPPVRGLANIDVVMASGPQGRVGHVNLELADGELALFSGISANLAVRFDGGRVQTDGYVRMAARASPGERAVDRCDGVIAGLRVTQGDGTLAGALLDPAAWKAVHGSVEVAAEDWNLRCLARLVPPGLLWSDLRGKLTTHFSLARGATDRFPSVRELFAQTRGLEIASLPAGNEPAPAWESRSIDVQVEGELDGATGHAGTRLSLSDGQPLVRFAIDAALDLPGLLEPSKRWAALRTSKVMARLEVPRRAAASFRTLPTFVASALPPVAGDAQLDATLDGTLDQPSATVHVRTWDVLVTREQGSLEASPWAFPVDLDGSVAYAGRKATLSAQVSHAGKAILTATGAVDADVRELYAGKVPAWSGDLLAQLTGVPLGEIPFFEDRELAGHLEGTIALSGLNQSPSVEVALRIPDLSISSDLQFTEAAVSLDIERNLPGTLKAGTPEASPDAAVALLRVGLSSAEKKGKEAGRLEATASAGVTFRAGILPVFDLENSGELYVKTQHFPLQAFHPAVLGALSRLEGRLDGDIRWRRLKSGVEGSVASDLAVSDAVVNIPQLGQEFRKGTVHVVAKNGEIRFDDLTAQGIRGRLTGKGVAHFTGLHFKDAQAEVAIPDGEDVPLALQGVPLGDLRGNVNVSVVNKPEALAAEVVVSRLSLALPQASGRNVQSLDDNPEITTSHPLGPPAAVRSGDARTIEADIKLGAVEVTGKGLRVALTTGAQPLKLVLRDRLQMTGDVQVVSGKFEVLGKAFEIDEQEKNLVHLRAEDAGNPYLNVTAFWDAPTGSRVYVNYVGVLLPVTNEKLKFRANPPASQQDILAMLLFGADIAQAQGTVAGGSAPSGGQSTQQAASGAAAGVGGELAAAQFNQLLAGIEPLKGFSTRLGTAEDGSLRTSLAYQLGDKVSAEASYAAAGTSGTPTGPAAAPTTSTASQPGGTASARGSRTQVSIDWRFRRNWSIRASVGVDSDTPTSGLDLLWQYRY